MHQTTHKLTIIIASCVIMFVSLSQLQAQVLEKTFNWDFDLNDSPTVIIDNRYCDFEIISTKNKSAKLTLEVMAKAEEQSELDAFEKALSNYRFNESPERLYIQIPLWESTIVHKFLFFGETFYTQVKNSERLRLRVLNHRATLYLPENAKLVINTKYSTINLPDLYQLTLSSYNDNIYAGNVSQKGRINAKYSKIEFDTIADNQIEINDTRLHCKKAGNLDINSRNSNINIDYTENITLTSAYDDIRFGRIGDLILNAKYGTIEGKDGGNIDINDVYDVRFLFKKTNSIEMGIINYSDVDIKHANDVKISSSKYSKFKIDASENFTIKHSYNDKLYLKHAESIDLGSTQYSTLEGVKTNIFNVDDSKYSKYYIDNTTNIIINSSYNDLFNHKKTLNISVSTSKYSEFMSQSTHNLKIYNSSNDVIQCDTIISVAISKSYNGILRFKKLHNSLSLSGEYDKVTIRYVSKDLKFITFENKYGELDINIDKSVPLKMEAEMEYGTLNFNQTDWQTFIDIRKNNSIKYIGYHGLRSDKNPLISIKGYNIKTTLQSR